MTTPKFLSIDEDGYFFSRNSDGTLTRWTDEGVGRPLLDGLFRSPTGAYLTLWQDEEVMVESFDHPLVARTLTPGKDRVWQLQAPYHFEAGFDLQTLALDEWDRIHGQTEAGVSFVLSRAAQAQFFEQLKDFDDSSFWWNGIQYEFQLWPRRTSKDLNPGFWDEGYRSSEQPGWDLGEPHPEIERALAQIKMSKSRILVFGAGRGHDAALLAKKGNLVTAVDFSGEAIKKAQGLYGSIPNLKFIQADVLKLPQQFDGTYDVVFEHTCFCAIPPERRADLTKAYSRVLSERGNLFAIFPLFDRENGPPYSCSEWEVRERLKKSFKALYWSRTRNTIPGRLGQELLVYSQKNTRL